MACIELSGFIVEKVDPLLFGYPLFINHIVHEDDESSLHRPLPSFSGCKLLVGCFGPLEALSAPSSNPNGTLLGPHRQAVASVHPGLYILSPFRQRAARSYEWSILSEHNFHWLS